MDKRTRLYHFFYVVMALSIIIIIINVAFRNNMVSPAEEMSENTASFDSGWKFENGDTAILEQLNKNEDVEPEKQFSVYNTLPEKLGEGQFLCFRTKNIFYKVYIDGELRYAPVVEESSAYNKSFGNRHNYVPLNAEDAGKTVCIKVTTVYKSAKAKIMDLYIGEAGGVVLSFLKQQILPVLSSILLLFIGILLIFADIPLNFKKEKNHELMYLGFSSLTIAVWCLLETGIMQLFWGDSRLIQTTSCTVLMLIIIPMVLYFDKAFGFGFKHIKGILCTLSFTEFIACFWLHYLKIMDFHETLVITHVLCVLSGFVMVVSVIKGRQKNENNQSKMIFHVFRLIGLSSIAIAAMLDILRYYISDSHDSAVCVRIGLIIFMICFGMSSLEKTINAVKLGARSEMISELAYKDGLTGVGNRTLFKEELDALEKNKYNENEIIIIMFDVNDLKYINDKMGHYMGDRLLVKSADIIRDSFKEFGGKCYRIGGDEFVVIIRGDAAEEHYNDGLKLFEQAVAEHNANPDKTFRISIAYGAAVYNASNREAYISDIWHAADAFMYQNKKEMKERMIEANAYYTGKLYSPS